MPVVRTEYQTGERNPALIQYDLGGTLTFPLVLAGVSTAPTSGTAILTNGSSTIHSGAVTIGPPPAFAVPSSALSESMLGMDKEARWTFLLGGVTRTYRQPVGIVRWVPACPVSHTSFAAGKAVLVRALQGTGQTTFDTWILRAWDEVQAWLANNENRAHLIPDITRLAPIVETWTLVRFLEDLCLVADPDGNYARALDRETAKLEGLKRDTTFPFDVTDSGDITADLRSATPPLYLASYCGSTRCL